MNPMAWLELAPALLLGAALVLVPGGAVLIAGWGPSLRSLLLAPLVSVALIAGTAVAAPMVGLAWGLLPVAMSTLIAVGAAWAVRRASPRPHTPRPPRRVWLAVAIGLGLAAAITGGRLVWAIQDPEQTSQLFDVIFHLNAVRYILDTGDASAFHIGDVGGTPMYPNGWSSLTSLIALHGGASIPAAANVANLVITAVVWPLSMLALADHLFQRRRLAFIATGAAMGMVAIYPYMLLSWGVLYANLIGYALLPAAVALIARLIGKPGPHRRDPLEYALLVVAVGGTALAHPNSLLAAVAIGAALGVLALVRAAAARRTPRAWFMAGVGITGIAIGSAFVWWLAQTDYQLWPPWESVSQAVGDALLLSPRLPVNAVVAICLILAYGILIRRPARYAELITMHLVALVLFVVAAGAPAESLIRQVLTDPWWNDPPRLATLLGLTSTFLVTVALLGIHDWLRRALPRRRPWTLIAPATLGLIAVSAYFSAAATVAVGVNTRDSYTPGWLLSEDERALLDELPDLVDDDALILGSSAAGVSLAWAIADRHVVEPHIQGGVSEEVAFLNLHLADIDHDPAVCEAVNEVGATHVLDFGDDMIISNGLSRWGGVVNLTENDHLALVAETGPNARLFEIRDC